MAIRSHLQPAGLLKYFPGQPLIVFKYMSMQYSSNGGSQCDGILVTTLLCDGGLCNLGASFGGILCVEPAGSLSRVLLVSGAYVLQATFSCEGPLLRICWTLDHLWPTVYEQLDLEHRLPLKVRCRFLHLWTTYYSRSSYNETGVDFVGAWYSSL